MGIRFECPNGHKLHVKAFLAGKRGICPDCGAKFWIPAAANGSLEVRPVHAAASSGGSLLGPSHDPSLPEPSSVIRLADEREKSTAKPATVAPPPGAIAAPPIFQPRLSLWYVRPANGGQFGPATDEVFKRWIADGRVTEDSLVWRDGWPEWKPVNEAADLLPMPLPLIVSKAPIAVPPGPQVPLTPDPLALEMVNEELGELSPSEEAASTKAVYHSLNRRVRQRQQRRKYAIILLLATLVLGLLFVLILLRNSSPEPAAMPVDPSIPLAQ